MRQTIPEPKTIYYILDEDDQPVKCEDVLKWGAWIQTANRTLKVDHFPGDIRVSTVFLGMDHGWGSGTPVLWETMIFGGEHDQDQWRAAARLSACHFHRKAVNMVRKSLGMGPLVPGKPNT